MERTGVQKLARVLKVLVIVLFILNIIAILLVPGCVDIMSYKGPPDEALGDILMPDGKWSIGVLSRGMMFFTYSFGWPLWLFGGKGYDVAVTVVSIFLMFCGVCTAIILWQAKRVLDTILAGEPFSVSNAANLRRAAVCCFLISGAALVRTVWGLFYYQSIAPLLTYNALFIPVFLMAGLLCMVVSALFRQAAELKAENDLTI